MRKSLILITTILAMLAASSVAMAAATASDWTRPVSGAFSSIQTLSVTITTDGAGGSLAATTIPEGGILGYNLVEVEIINDSDTAALTITNANGTAVWSLAAMAGSNEIQPGFLSWGVSPVKDGAWAISSGAIGASDEITVILKFKK